MFKAWYVEAEVWYLYKYSYYANELHTAGGNYNLFFIPIFLSFYTSPSDPFNWGATFRSARIGILKRNGDMLSPEEYSNLIRKIDTIGSYSATITGGIGFTFFNLIVFNPYIGVGIAREDVYKTNITGYPGSPTLERPISSTREYCPTVSIGVRVPVRWWRGNLAVPFCEIYYPINDRKGMIPVLAAGLGLAF